MASTTGNIAIEVRCVNTTKSNIWVYKINNEYWAINLKWLKEQVSTQGRFVYGGDGGRSYMKLVPVIEFKSVASKITFN